MTGSDAATATTPYGYLAKPVQTHELRASEERFHDAFELAPVGMAWWVWTARF